MGAGVPAGLQHQFEGLVASWVGSIPTHSRQNNCDTYVNHLRINDILGGCSQ